MRDPGGDLDLERRELALHVEVTGGAGEFPDSGRQCYRPPRLGVNEEELLFHTDRVVVHRRAGTRISY
ncbi:hypothetical protein FXN61_08455 [Lentzea sp. PSKA42]|uniref:Uncharacterized protein n=1 Tax=Lentzea indica TaxID=2604800 RepID=A0ABX1FD27_9PSEU|nr:hypothetical protein [Lentzea indica]NKE56868.1 hypothetical protein [Lentzea indica]